MIAKLRLLLEYHAYPVWLYDEEGDVIDTLLPPELRDDHALDEKFDALQDRFDALYIDNPREFTYVGFKSAEEERRFLRDLDDAVAELQRKLHGKYPIVNDIRLAFPSYYNIFGWDFDSQSGELTILLPKLLE